MIIMSQKLRSFTKNNGEAFLYLATDANWHHLYNNMHWESDTLPYQS